MLFTLLLLATMWIILVLCLIFEESVIEALEGAIRYFISKEVHTHETHIDDCLAHVALSSLSRALVYLSSHKIV